MLSEICRVEKSVRLLVSGRVQRVGYREACRQEAEKLGIRGWVRNLADGRVELQACGDTVAVENLRAWCHKGPWLAQVSDVSETAVELPCGENGFRVLR